MKTMAQMSSVGLTCFEDQQVLECPCWVSTWQEDEYFVSQDLRLFLAPVMKSDAQLLFCSIIFWAVRTCCVIFIYLQARHRTTTWLRLEELWLLFKALVFICRLLPGPVETSKLLIWKKNCQKSGKKIRYHLQSSVRNKSLCLDLKPKKTREWI